MNTLKVGFYMSERRIQKNKYDKFLNHAQSDPRIDFTQLNLSEPIKDHFDAIVHSVTDEMVFLDNQETSPHEKEEINKKISNLKEYFKNNPDTVNIDPIENQAKILDRTVINCVLVEVEKSLNRDLGVRMPKHITIDNATETYDIGDLKYPLVCKTVLSCGTNSSHHMGVVFNEKGLHDFAPPFVIQEFFNHNSISFKVYVLGDNIKIEKRKSLPNLPLHNEKSIFFDSQKPFIPQISQSIQLDTSKTEDQLMEEAIIPSMDIVRPLSKALSGSLGLTLFGYDLITNNQTGHHAVIDVNYFPNFMSMDDGSQKLLDFVINQVQFGRKTSKVEVQIPKELEDIAQKYAKNATTIFPHDILIEDVREALKDLPEFHEKPQEDFIVFNYKWCNGKTFPDPKSSQDPRTAHLLAIRREARGLMFNAETGKILSRRYHKFFNIGELPETQPDLVDLSQPHNILVKYDGTLITAVRSRGKIRFASKGGFGGESAVLQDRFISQTKIRYVEMCEWLIDHQLTPIFEFCSPRFKIVLEHETDLLILTGIRHNVTGNYMTHKEMKAIGDFFDVPVAEVFSGDVKGLEDFMVTMKAVPQIEGFVIRFEDGRMYKVKTEWYFERTKKSKSEYNTFSERGIWLLILNQEIDDAMADMKDAVRVKCIKQFEVTLWNAIVEAAKNLFNIAKEQYDKGNANDGRQFTAFLTATQPKAAHPILFLYAKKLKEPNFGLAEAQDLLIESLKKACTSKTSLDNARLLLGGIKLSEKVTEGDK